MMNDNSAVDMYQDFIPSLECSHVKAPTKTNVFYRC